MSFIDFRLSDRVSAGFQGGPEWSTSIAELRSGREVRNGGWAMPRHKFSADYVQLEDEERQVVKDAFWSAMGRLYAFRVKDWGDFKAVNEPIGDGDGLATPLQLTKGYTFGPQQFVRRITKPIASTVVVKAGAAVVGVTVNAATGMVTPLAPWPLGAPITASFQFDVPVRFGSDHYNFTLPDRRITAVSIDLVEDLSA